MSTTLRLALLYALLFTSSVVGLFGFVYWSSAGYLAEQTDEAILAEIDGLQQLLRVAGLAGLKRRIDERSQRRTSVGSSIYLLADSKQNIISGNLDQWPRDGVEEAGWIEFPIQAHSIGDARMHTARVKVFELSGGNFYLMVGRDVQDLADISRALITALVWGLAITAVLAVMVALLISRQTGRRLESINQTAREIMQGDLSRRIPSSGSGDEFDEVAGNLNRMLARIEELLDGVRQVSSNIAHDLRTPLARLRNRLENLSSQPDAEDIDAAIAQADGLLQTFNALLRISRIETEARREAFAEVDLAALLADIHEMYGPVAEDAEQQLQLDIQGSATLNGDRDLLFQAVANLVDNAIKHSGVGGKITLRLRQCEQRILLEVADNGPGIPAAERRQVLQRFYRLETSRSTPGNGLGLSLVAAVAGLHDAQLAFEDNQPGLLVKLSLPA